jgi:flagellar protein FliS
MNSLNKTAMLAEYQSVATHGGVAAADPHRLVLLLLDGTLDRIMQARGCIERRSQGEKGRLLNRAIALLQELRGSLNFDNGGQIAVNLDGLYEYCIRQITVANAEDRAQTLDHVAALLQEIRGAWIAVPNQVRLPAML